MSQAIFILDMLLITMIKGPMMGTNYLAIRSEYEFARRRGRRDGYILFEYERRDIL